ncbi:MAG: isoprenylcysteine carboxylmethyltransferase family protein [Maribacter sp.]
MSLQSEMQSQGNFLFKYRSHLPLIFLAVALAVYLYGTHNNVMGSENIFMEYFWFICLGVCLLGLFIRIKIVGHTPSNTSGRNTKQGQVADELNTTGMYSLVRHPLYVGNFFMWLGVAMLTANLWFIIAFILLYTVYYERIMFAEEQFLIGKFGTQYTDWSKTTPAFIPDFKKYTSPKYPFSLKKVIKKEKNGVVAIFALFWLFKWAGDTLENGFMYFDLSGWFYAAVISAVLYFILKIMKKRKMLD